MTSYPASSRTWGPGFPSSPVVPDALSPDPDALDCWCGWTTGLRDECVCWWDSDDAPECHCEECEEERLAELRAFVGPPWITLIPNPEYL